MNFQKKKNLSFYPHLSKWVSDCCLMPKWAFFYHIMARMSYIQWNDDDDVRFVQDQHAKLNLYKASSQKQQFAGRHVAPLRHIMLILSQPVFALTPWSCVVSREAANTNFIISDLTPIRAQIQDLLHSRQEANHYTTDAISSQEESMRNL